MSESEHDVLKLILDGVNENQRGIQHLGERFASLETKVGTNYAELKTRLDEGEKIISSLQASAKECDGRFIELNSLMTGFGRDLKSLEQQVPAIVKRQDKFDTDLSGFGKRLNLAQGIAKGAAGFWAYLVAGVGVLFGFISLVFTFWNLSK